MKLPRRHHFVPELIQRRFTNASGRLYVFDKRRPDSGVFSTIPGNVFVQKDLNSIELKDGSKHAGLELWYSKLESDVAPIIEKIVVRARSHMVPSLNWEEKGLWDNFFYHQQKRAPDIFERFGLVSEFEKDLPNYIAEYERAVRPLSEEERDAIQTPQEFKRMVQMVSVQARGFGSEEVIEELAKLGLAVAVVGSPKKSFILGDHPLVGMGPTGQLGHPETELWMPVAPDVAVSPWGQPGEEKLISIDGDQVRRINKHIFTKSNTVAGRSEALIRSLSGFRVAKQKP